MAAPHRHPNVELNLVIEGAATYLLEGRRYELRPGTLVWLFPGQDHILANRSAEYRDWLGLFSQAALLRLCASPRSRVLLDPNPPGDFARRLTPDAAARLDALFTHVGLTANPDVSDAGLRYAALAAWDAFHDAREVAISRPLHPAVSAAARIMRDDAGNLTISALARMVGMSPNHLSRIFHSQMGVSISRFRNEQRFHRYLHARDTGEHTSILQAALAAGFGSYAQFFRVFRQLTGSNPSAYLRQSRRHINGA